MTFDAANNSLPSGSYFRKAVTLQNWWLTKPKTHEDMKTLGVAGTSQQNHATRCFSSAPILKAYDIVELETIDSVSIILQGFINQERTLENGFSPEVFDHFVFGFPPYWEEFSTSFLEEGSAAKCASRVHEDRKDSKDSIEGHADIHEASSLEILHMTKAGHDVLINGRSSVTSEIEDASFIGTSHIERNAVDSCTGSKGVGVSSRRMTRSMSKKDSSKSNNSVLLHDTSNLDKVTVINPLNLGSCDILRTDINQGKNRDADVSGEPEVNTTRSDLEAKHFKSECSDPLSSTNVDVIDVNDEIVLPRTNMKACQNKKKNREGKSASRIDVPHKGVPATLGTGSKIAIMTRSKSKSKLTTKSPKSAKSTSKAKKGPKESVKILSPESFSRKKSRSGRALLPVLEFWRNEQVVYDAELEAEGSSGAI